MHSTGLKLSNDAGITLLEMLAVLSILALSLMVIAPSFKNPLQRMNFEAEVRQFYSTLETSRTQAIRKNKSVDVIIDVTAQSYKSSLYPLTSNFPANTKIDLETAASNVTDNQAVITFYPDGSAMGADIGIGNGTQSYLISVDWLLGDITMERQFDAP